MKITTTLTQFALLTGVIALPSSQNVHRCTSGQGCWPTQSDFQPLISQVFQLLLHLLPPSAPCNDPTRNCTAVGLGWADGNRHTDHPGSMQSPTARCSLPETARWRRVTILSGECDQGNVPVIGVDAHLIEDIQAGVVFASRHNLRLVIKNTV